MGHLFDAVQYLICNVFKFPKKAWVRKELPGGHSRTTGNSNRGEGGRGSGGGWVYQRKILGGKPPKKKKLHL